ncbi:hypoxanthine-guanine phosphoribosyl transferase [Streptococcus pyogenes]|nr:hypoxanthine-guanine phosphoribosyl transferase [Streptococcus pyogenes]
MIIIRKTKKLGEQLTKDYQEKNPLMIGVLKGSVPFMAELMNTSILMLKLILW